MLTTFVIGLREGLEAALIVGHHRSIPSPQGRRDALRAMWVGVGSAVAICMAVGVGLQLVDNRCRSASRRASRPWSRWWPRG